MPSVFEVLSIGSGSQLSTNSDYDEQPIVQGGGHTTSFNAERY